MSGLTFDCPQGCGAKLRVETPKVDGVVTNESLWTMERALGVRVMNAVVGHAIYDCTKLAPHIDLTKIPDGILDEETL